jgi:hypothetical protein
MEVAPDHLGGRQQQILLSLIARMLSSAKYRVPFHSLLSRTPVLLPIFRSYSCLNFILLPSSAYPFSSPSYYFDFVFYHILTINW